MEVLIQYYKRGISKVICILLVQAMGI